MTIMMQKKYSLSQFIRTDGPSQHWVKQGTPTLGGIAIILAQLIALMPSINNLMISFYLKSITVFFCIGLFDDLIKIKKISNGFSAKTKFILQILAAYALMTQSPSLLPVTYIPIYGWLTLPTLLWILLILFTYSGTANAINLTDGLDGLLSWILIGVWLTFLLFMIRTPIDNVFSESLLTLAVVNLSSLISFLYFNRYPALIFMGDCGSLALGAGFAAVFCAFNAPILLFPILIIPVAETVSVMLQVASMRITGKRIFKMAPIHHHFEQLGYHETTITKYFILINTLSCFFITWITYGISWPIT
jgi:phospho-N-acetylmuramoyl-pentapeptide-transferase